MSSNSATISRRLKEVSASTTQAIMYSSNSSRVWACADMGVNSTAKIKMMVRSRTSKSPGCGLTPLIIAKKNPLGGAQL